MPGDLLGVLVRSYCISALRACQVSVLRVGIYKKLSFAIYGRVDLPLDVPGKFFPHDALETVGVDLPVDLPI